MKSIAVAINMMYSRGGEKQLYGGAMRWCRDLTKLLTEVYENVCIYQKSDLDFDIMLNKGVKLFGLRAKESMAGNFTFERRLRSIIGLSAPVIFVTQELGVILRWENSITVNHGVWWDGDYPTIKKMIIKKMHNRLINIHKRTICVDTAYINWLHTEIRGRKKFRSKLRYIPNYAGDEFFDAESTSLLPHSANMINILFPRRTSGHDLLEQGRGLGVFLEMLLLLQNNGIDFLACICGRGNLQSR